MEWSPVTIRSASSSRSSAVSNGTAARLTFNERHRNDCTPSISSAALRNTVKNTLRCESADGLRILVDDSEGRCQHVCHRKVPK